MDGGGFIKKRSGGTPGVALADPANQISLPSGPRRSLASAKRDEPTPISDEDKIAAFIKERGVIKCPTAFAAASDGYTAVVESETIRAHRFQYKGNGGRGKAGAALIQRERKRMAIKRALARRSGR